MVNRNEIAEVYRFECPHVSPVVGPLRVSRSDVLLDMASHVVAIKPVMSGGFLIQCRPVVATYFFEYTNLADS